MKEGGEEDQVDSPNDVRPVDVGHHHQPRLLGCGIETGMTGHRWEETTDNREVVNGGMIDVETRQLPVEMRPQHHDLGPGRGGTIRGVTAEVGPGPGPGRWPGGGEGAAEGRAAGIEQCGRQRTTTSTTS